MNVIAVAGVGLIGGSFALALRKAGFTGEILGVSSQPSIALALDRRIVDEGVTLAEAAKRADLLYLAQPIEQILNTIEQLGGLLGAGCLVTDAGSTKEEIVARAARFLPTGSFLGGHPMAGKEQRGSEYADADLFQGRPYILTPELAAPIGAEFRGWLARIGAEVLEMTAAEHDETVAWTSHLPQILSTTLAAALATAKNPHIERAFGPGLLDMTRLALSSPEMWSSILKTNRKAISRALSSFREMLEEGEEPLLAGEVDPLFRSAADFASKIRSSGPPIT